MEEAMEQQARDGTIEPDAAAEAPQDEAWRGGGGVEGPAAAVPPGRLDVTAAGLCQASNWRVS